LLTIILAEGGYREQLIHWVEEELGLKLERELFTKAHAEENSDGIFVMDLSSFE